MIPFWNSLVDNENGGFYSYVDHDLIVNKGSFKSAILHARILWFYSNCYLVLKDEKCLNLAKHCYDFMVKHFIDKESGGIFWSVNVKGVPANPMKHIYCHAFFLYALSSYYDATKDSLAMNNAMRMFELIETQMCDTIGYRECFDRDWNLIDNDELSENGIKAEKTMNTILHLIEAYTELYRVNKNGDVLTRLKYLLELIHDRVYDKPNRRLNVFFDNNMNVLGNIYSYGHDIEAAWLLNRAIDIAGEPPGANQAAPGSTSSLPVDLCEKIREMSKVLAAKIDEVAFDEDGSMYYENDNGMVNKKRVWWVQAEALVGFLDAHEVSGEQKYLDRATRMWEYIKARVIDRRPGGEWYNELNKDGVPDTTMPTVDEWKCPYHNGRMCLQVIARGE
ncbi:MAG: AGE family epimerase/isomerase [Oscillospiraceae bacterium]|nr:AGE family epimerase/isomerase [Oscillospiraceae bacterium]